MTTSQLLNAVMFKHAANSWARMLAQKLLSPEAESKLKEFLPSTVTRQIGPMLGKGQEGRVFPSFTGGVGDTATKVYNKFDPTKRFNVSTGAQQARAGFMDADPKSFPLIHSTRPNSLIEEKLQHIPDNDPLLDLLPQIADARRTYVGGRTAVFANKRNGNYPAMLQNMWNRRQTYMQMLKDPELDRLPEIMKPTPTRPLQDINGMVQPQAQSWQGTRVSDFGVRRYARGDNSAHNLMQRPNGQWVVSDPAVWWKPEGSAHAVSPWSDTWNSAAEHSQPGVSNKTIDLDNPPTKGTEGLGTVLARYLQTIPLSAPPPASFLPPVTSVHGWSNL